MCLTKMVWFLRKSSQSLDNLSCILAIVFRSLVGPNGEGGGGTPWACNGPRPNNRSTAQLGSKRPRREDSHCASPWPLVPAETCAHVKL